VAVAWKIHSIKFGVSIAAAKITAIATLVISSFSLNHFVGEADGPSGWHVPVVPFRPRKQRHGLLQTSPLVHGLPHATTA